MVNGYGYHLPDRITKPAKMVQTPTAGVLFLWVCRDSRVSGARGAAPCCGKAAISERGESTLCGDKPSAERTRPQGCISAPFVPKGLFSVFRPSAAFFQISSRAGSLVKASRRKCGGFLVGHGLGFRHNALKDRAPDDKAVAARPCVPLGTTSAATSFPGFQAAGFSSFRPQSRRCTSSRVFSLGFVIAGRSFLPVGIEKGQSIFSAVPFGWVIWFYCVLLDKLGFYIN